MKKTMLVILSIIFIGTNSFAINDWKQGSNTAPIEGTSNASDIDTNLSNNAIDPLDKLLSDYIYGCSLTWTTSEIVTIGIGELTCMNGAGTIKRMRKNTATTTIDMTVVGVGGIDSGSSEAINTWYDVYAVADANATTFTAICAEQGNALSDVTYYRYVGSFLNNSSGNIEKFLWSGNGNTIKINFEDAYSTELKVLNGGTAAAFVANNVDLSGVIPTSSTMASLIVVSTAGDSVYLRKGGSTVTNGYYFATISAGQSHLAMDIPVSSSQSIEYHGAGGAISMWIKDFTFKR